MLQADLRIRSIFWVLMKKLVWLTGKDAVWLSRRVFLPTYIVTAIGGNAPNLMDGPLSLFYTALIISVCFLLLRWGYRIVDTQEAVNVFAEHITKETGIPVVEKDVFVAAQLYWMRLFWAAWATLFAPLTAAQIVSRPEVILHLVHMASMLMFGYGLSYGEQPGKTLKSTVKGTLRRVKNTAKSLRPAPLPRPIPVPVGS